MSVRWPQKKIDDLVAAGRVKVIEQQIAKPKKKVKPRHIPAGLQFIKNLLSEYQIPFEAEYLFARPRLFRFDIAIPSLMVAIEYEGLVATGRKGGHQTKAHYTNNCTKYNLAASKGWRLYRYTYRNYRDFENDLKEIINNDTATK